VQCIDKNGLGGVGPARPERAGARSLAQKLTLREGASLARSRLYSAPSQAYNSFWICSTLSHSHYLPLFSLHLFSAALCSSPPKIFRIDSLTLEFAFFFSCLLFWSEILSSVFFCFFSFVFVILVWIAFLRSVFPASVSSNFAAEGPPSPSPCYLVVASVSFNFAAQGPQSRSSRYLFVAYRWSFLGF
jgi:hypothetical protein